MFNKLSGSIPFPFSDDKSRLEIPTSSGDTLKITQKANIIARETLIKVCGTKDHWISLYDLGAQSEVFKNMFSRNWKESKTSQLDIESEEIENKEIIDQFIECLETRNSQYINEGNFQEILSLAYEYEVSWLVKDCEQFIVLNLTVDNVLSVIKDIAIPFGLQNLLRNCFIYLFKNKDSLNKESMKEIQELGEEHCLIVLKIIAARDLHPYVSILEYGPYIFDIIVKREEFERYVKLLIQIFSKESIHKFPVNLKIIPPVPYPYPAEQTTFPALFEFCKSNPKLTSLDLAGNQIGIAGAIEIAEALTRNETLTSLDLRMNYIEDAGAIQLAEALKENKTLTSLHLGWNTIGDVGAIQLAAALKENKTLTSLNLRDNYHIGDAGATQLAAALKENKILTSLNLDASGIKVAGTIQIAGALKENKTLTTLDLSGSDIGNEGVLQIAGALKENHTLTSMNLSWTKIGDEFVTAIAAALKENKTLTCLTLEHNTIGEAGATQIAGVLKENKTLTSLNLAYNQIGNRGAIQIAIALKENQTLTTFDLTSNQIEDGALQIAAALKENKTLTSLKLWSNKIENAQAIEIAAALKENSTLTTLDLSFNNIRSQGAIQLAAALKENKTLTFLGLTLTEIGEEGATHIASALKVNKTLTNLGEVWNRVVAVPVTAATAALIEASLEENRSRYS